jgi:hypothetical protein
MVVRLVHWNEDRAAAIRDHVLPLIRMRGSLQPQGEVVRLITWRVGGWRLNHWTPFNELTVGEASSPGYRHALQRQHASSALGYGLEIWSDRKLFSVIWDDGRAIDVVSFERGDWEQEVLALS